MGSDEKAVVDPKSPCFQCGGEVGDNSVKTKDGPCHYHNGDCITFLKERNGLWEKYAALLIDEVNETAGMAMVHGWRSSRVEEGEKMRIALGINKKK